MILPVSDTGCNFNMTEGQAYVKITCGVYIFIYLSQNTHLVEININVRNENMSCAVCR